MKSVVQPATAGLIGGRLGPVFRPSVSPVGNVHGVGEGDGDGVGVGVCAGLEARTEVEGFHTARPRSTKRITLVFILELLLKLV